MKLVGDLKEKVEKAKTTEKAKAFAAKCDREIIEKGCEMLGMEPKEVAEICIEGMKPYAEELGLLGTEH